jgi:hypothetical protein
MRSAVAAGEEVRKSVGQKEARAEGCEQDVGGVEAEAGLVHGRPCTMPRRAGVRTGTRERASGSGIKATFIGRRC